MLAALAEHAPNAEWKQLLVTESLTAVGVIGDRKIVTRSLYAFFGRLQADDQIGLLPLVLTVAEGSGRSWDATRGLIRVIRSMPERVVAACGEALVSSARKLPEREQEVVLAELAEVAGPELARSLSEAAASVSERGRAQILCRTIARLDGETRAAAVRTLEELTSSSYGLPLDGESLLRLPDDLLRADDLRLWRATLATLDPDPVGSSVRTWTDVVARAP
jgi:hypothetical protein